MAFEHSLQHLLVSFLKEETEDLRAGNPSQEEFEHIDFPFPFYLVSFYF